MASKIPPADINLPSDSLPPRHWFGLREKLMTIILGLLLTSLFVGSALYFFRSQSILKTTIEKHLAANIVTNANLVETYVHGLRENLRLLTSRTQLRLSLAQLLEDPADKTAEVRLQQILQDAHSAIEEINHVFLLGPEGQLLLQTSSFQHYASIPVAEIIERSQSGEDVIDLIRVSENNHLAIMAGELRVGERFLGALVATVQLDGLREIVYKAKGVGVTDELIINYLDENGVVQPILPLKYPPDPANPKLRFSPFIGAVDAPRHIYADDYRNVRVIAASLPLRSVPWGVTLKVDEEDALRPVQNQREFMIILLLSAILLSVIVALFISSSITTPIISISQAALLVAGGDFSHRIRNVSQDELGQLAYALNKMADRLVSAKKMLEKKLADEKHHSEELNDQLMYANNRLSEMVRTDALTCIANRRYLDETMESECRRSTRTGQPLSLLLLDIDCFKQYNDSLGHPAGDECLKKVAAILKKCTGRAGDLVARYGGEEFAILLADTDENGARKVAQKIQAALKERQIEHPKSLIGDYLTLSIGGISISGGINLVLTSDDLLRYADEELYNAKEAGRDHICLKSLDGDTLPDSPKKIGRLTVVD